MAEFRIITHNIRLASPGDIQSNERPWKQRLPLIINELKYHTRFLDGRNLIRATKPANGSSNEYVTIEDSANAHPESRQSPAASIICLQECEHVQVVDVLTAMNDREPDAKPITPMIQIPSGPHWAHVGVGREDGATQGEHSPILYPVQIFDLVYWDNTWLSETPDRPSKHWNANCIRILTSAVLENKFTKQRIAVFNTHLDNESQLARAKSIEIILGKIDGLTTTCAVHAPRRLPFVFTGDFNAHQHDPAYRDLTSSLVAGGVVDSYEAVSPAQRYGAEHTFTGFQPWLGTKEDQGEKGRIDYVFFGPRSQAEGSSEDITEARWKIEGYAALSNETENRLYCSDHRAVVADAVLIAQ
ncbi:endonuclease/exonuclease/phosphatase family protein [Teratosphaeria destructans]|uniref:Endonuclease/exonuclease/phosphatase family protein n=1 Tax=Teratosphaeria destructans TaxID=418781 RepID=A0A9W7SVZ3_9PEZI|nr:endonuclease/exonuclease/phosphatase family protein [Teratosphaeria destructans]